MSIGPENLLWHGEAMALRLERMGKTPADEAAADEAERDAEERAARIAAEEGRP